MRSRFSIPFVLFTALWLVSCHRAAYESLPDGVVVRVAQPEADGARYVRLQVKGDKLIRVSATARQQFADRNSLVVLPTTNDTPFRVETTDSTITLATAALCATVSRTTGKVQFADIQGNLILSECEQGRKFIPYEAGGKQAYSVQQCFDSPSDEAFYGLGQHQSDEFNYKGKNEELFQYNTKVSIPFVVSNKNYGILWDSYSLCRFGNPNGYAQLGEVFQLYDKAGHTGALTGTYTPANEHQMEPIVRSESSLYFEHLCRNDLSKVIGLPENFPMKGAKVVYEGEIEPAESGYYQFILYYAGYVKVYMDNQLVVPERWRTSWNPNHYKFACQLTGKQRVPLRIEWDPDGDVSYCGLRVLPPTTDEVRGEQSWWSEMNPEIDYYFVYGHDIDEVISGYRTLTGKAQVMPKWAMGFWQSRERYKTQQELISTLAEFRKREIPIDNIVQDWSYWEEDAWGSHEFDKARFPDPKAMVEAVHAMHAHFMISVWPKFYISTAHYKEFSQQGWMYQQAVVDSIRDWIGPGYIGSFYDAYAPAARKLFWDQMNEHLYALGIDAWWMDASEPNIRDCTDIRYRKDLCGPTALGSSDEYFNAYALMNADAIYNGQRSVNPYNRVFLLTRSGFSGLQRYSTATWSGDIASRWEDMKAQISAGLNFAISGVPYWTMDIGGFCVEDRYVAAQKLFDETGIENTDLKEWRELNTRWYQFGAFCPLYRAHGQFPLREVWNIAPNHHPAYQSIVHYTKLRYRLMPYIYSLAGMTHFADYTIMRPLVMDFTTDNEVWNISDQYMFGSALMVCPVYTYGARSRRVYLPTSSVWYDFYTGKLVASGYHEATAPYEQIPLFVPGGAIIPYGPAIQYATQCEPSQITLYVYQGADGKFTLYEDEGTNYNYEQGAYATIELTYNEANHTVTLGERKGSFEGMLKVRTFHIVSVSLHNAQGYHPDAQGITVQYDGTAQTVQL